jgi:hypothetical protein
VTRIIPTTVKAGLTFTVTADLAEYPAPVWSLVLLLRGPSSITIDSTADGAAHRLAATAAATAAWAGGEYAFSLRATNGADVVEIEAGTVAIVADLAGIVAGTDTRTHVRRTLEAIEAVIERRATLDQERYRIGDRELYRTPIADLLKLRSVYREELRRMNAAAAGQSSLLGRTVLVRC